MDINLHLFFLTHFNIIILVIFNIFILLAFMLLYAMCYNSDPKSFNDRYFENSKKVRIGLIDHFLLSVAIQSGVGYARIMPASDTAKTLVSLQQFIVMSASLVSVYIFIYFFTRRKY